MANLQFETLVFENRRNGDDFVCTTVWAKEFGKEWKKYKESARCKKISTHLATKLDVRVSYVIQTKRGKGSETWVHPVIAIDFAEWLSTDFGIFVKEIFLSYLKGDADLAVDMLTRDQDKDRVERAKRRLDVVSINKQVNEMASNNGVPHWQIHNDRYLGLYKKDATQLRAECGAKEKETPLNYMGDRDLSLNRLANQAAIESGDLSRIGFAATLFREAFEKAAGKQLSPDWQGSCLPPSKARKLLQTQ